MAVYTRYVDPDAAAGGDGTTAALSGANCAYVSLNAWEAAEQAAHGATDDDIVYCGSAHANHTADTTAVTIDGWTDKTSGSIQVIGNLTSGVWDNTKYRLVTLTNANYTLAPREDYASFVALQVGNDTSADWTPGAILGAYGVGSYAVFDRCVVRGWGANAHYRGIQAPDYGAWTIRNTVVFGWGAQGITVGPANADGNRTRLQNVTVFGCDIGIYNSVGGGYTTLENCLVIGNTTTDFDARGVSWGTCDHNVSSDATAPGTTVATGKTTYADYFTDYANGNFNLKGSSNTLFGIDGEDLSATFTTDITGATRTAPWDIGAFKAPAASGQFARPISDVLNEHWLNQAESDSNLFQSVDEVVADDADYVYSHETDNSHLTLGLGPLNMPDAGTVTLRIRAKYV
jgi:hypothetical protein